MSSIWTYSRWLLHLALSILAILFLADNSPAFFENARYRTFNKQEILSMEQTTATIETKFGEITLKFFPEVAPNHVNSFIELARDGFYDGTTFHRIVPGFVIQGGDPNTKSNDRSRHGMGGPGFTLKAEFSKLPHKRGTLSMARAAHPDSAGSQFFICVADAPFLDGEYTVFGEVVKGMDVVDKIVSQPKDQRDNPIDRVEMKVRVVGPKEKP
jgi:peptidyl-prolyl cis-trans isomerase B (cyclophilin B)